MKVYIVHCLYLEKVLGHIVVMRVVQLWRV